MIVSDALRNWRALGHNLSMIDSLNTPDPQRLPLLLTPSITLSIDTLNQSNCHELVDFVAMTRSPLVSIGSRVYLAGAEAGRSWHDRIVGARTLSN